MAKIKGERKKGPRANTVYYIDPTTKFDKAAIKALTEAGRIPTDLNAGRREDLFRSQGLINASARLMELYAKRRRIEVTPDGNLTLFGNTTKRELGI